MQFFKCNVCFELFFKRARLKHEHPRILRKKRALALLLTTRLRRVLVFWNQQSKLSFAITENTHGILREGAWVENVDFCRILLFAIWYSQFSLFCFVNHCVRFQENSVPKSEFYFWRMSQRRYVNLVLDGISQGSFCNHIRHLKLLWIGRVRYCFILAL